MSLSNSAKNTKDEHLLCTAKQKYYNLSKFKIANSLSSANKNDALHLEEAEKGQGKIGKITDGAIGTKKGRKGKKTLFRNSGKVIWSETVTENYSNIFKYVVDDDNDDDNNLK